MYDGPRVFLSSTGRDLDGYRSAIIKALNTTEFFRVVAQENFGIEPTYPRDACAARVQKCDLFVGVVGFYRGGEIDGDNLLRSFTEHEYDTAADYGKPRFIAVVPDDHPMPAMYVSKGEFGDRQDAFRRKALKDSVAGVKFGNEDVLALNVINALWKHVFVERELAKASRHTTVTPEQARAFEEVAGQLAEEKIIDLAALAKGTVDFDPAKTEAELGRRANALVAEAEDKRKEAAALWRQIGAIAGLGDPKRAREAYAEAALLDPNDINGMQRHATFQYHASDLVEAERAARHVLTLGAPGVDDHDIFWSRQVLGWVQGRRGDLDSAFKTLKSAQESVEYLAKSDADDVRWQRALSVSWMSIGEVLTEQGDLPGALDAYRQDLAIARVIANADERNVGWQRDLAISHQNIGGVLEELGDFGGALEAYHAGVTIFERHSASNPEHVDWQIDLSSANERIGNVYYALSDLPAALKQYRLALDRLTIIRDRDPDNLGLQRHTWTMQGRIGDVHQAQGNLIAALEAFKAVLGTLESLSNSDPGDASWQRDISVSHDKIGGVLEALGRVDEALAHYQIDLEIAERLSKLDPSNARWQRDVEISRARMARLKP